MNMINESEQYFVFDQDLLSPKNEAEKMTNSEEIIPLELPPIETLSSDQIIIETTIPVDENSSVEEPQENRDADIITGELSNQVPAEVVDSLLRGESVQLIVEYDTREIEPQVNFRRQQQGLTDEEPNTPSITDFKAQAYQDLEAEVLSSLSGIEVLNDYSHLPLNLIEVSSAEDLTELLENPDVVQVYPDQFNRLFDDSNGEEQNKQTTSVEDNSVIPIERPQAEASDEDEYDDSVTPTDWPPTKATEPIEGVFTPQLAESLPQINQPTAEAAGYTGAGTTVAVLDTGADPNAPGLVGRIVFAQDFAPDDGSDDDNGHGTNVSAIAAAVAPDTDIAALDVFTGLYAYDSDLIDAINWSIANQTTYNIVAMNMSLGGGLYSSPITSGDPLLPSIQDAKAAGILTVAASGNSYSSNSLSSPAAIEGAVSVGAVDTGDNVASFSNSASFLDLLAPGVNITAGGLSNYSGTSMAAPHVSGAVAVLAAADSTDSPDDIVDTLKTTGVSITDNRNSLDFPRIDLALALGLTPPPPPPPPSEDNYEENDDLATAYYPGYNWEQTWLSGIDGIGVAKDEDWYEIDVSPTGYERILVDLQFTHADGDIDLELYDSSGTLLASSDSTTDDESIDYTASSTGSYYLKVYSDSNSGNTYDLWWDDVPAPFTPGNVDLSGAYFDIIQDPLDAGDSFDVDFEIQNTESGNAGGFYADFYLSTDPIIDNSFSSDDILLGYQWIPSLAGNSTTGILSESLILPEASNPFWDGDGTYYIGVISDALDNLVETDETNNASIGESVDYESIEITIPTITDDNYEDNDTLATAYYPGYDWEQTWLSSIDGDGIANDSDWYEIEVDSGEEQILVDLQFSDAAGDIDLALYDSSGTLLTGSYSVSDNESIDYTVSNPGTYYLRVYPYSGLGNTYDLWWDAAPPSTDVNLSGSNFNVVQEPLGAGDSFDVNFEIRNDEAGNANGFYADFYLSQDPIIDNSVGSDDILLDYQWIPSLAGNSTTGFLSQNLTLPDASDSFWNGDGTYYIGMISDALDHIVETDETNNASIGEFLDYDGVQITIPQPTAGVDNDFDGDGKADIHWRNDSQNQIWLMNGTTVNTQRNIDSLDAAWEAVGNGDFDGNGKADLIYRNGNETQIFEINRTTVVNTFNLDDLDSAWSIAGIGDTDGDGDDDILFRNGNANRLWEMENFSVVNKINIGNFNSAWSVVGLGDTDGDGDDDILFRNGNANRLWEMEDNTVANKINIGGFNSAWSVVGLGDTDGDGDDEIIWRKDNANRIWEMENNTRLNTLNIGNFNSAWQAEDVEDYDGDGDDDIMFRNGDQNQMWEMQNNAVANKTDTDILDSAWTLIG